MAAKQVVVVGDFLKSMDLLCNMLRRIGLEDIRHARKPDAARQQCEECNFERVCFDYNMRECKSGMRLQQALRYSIQVELHA